MSRSARVLMCVALVAGFLVAGATARWRRRRRNDDFADRVSLSGITGQVDGTNVEATFESGEPLTGGGDTVWYDWTTPVGGHATVRTCAADFDTTLAVYTGDTLASLVLVGSNDDDCGSGSVVQWTATAGTELQGPGGRGQRGRGGLHPVLLAVHHRRKQRERQHRRDQGQRCHLRRAGQRRDQRAARSGHGSWDRTGTTSSCRAAATTSSTAAPVPTRRGTTRPP